MKYTKEIEGACPVCKGTGKTVIRENGTKAMVKELKKNGHTYGYIAEKLSIPLSTVHYYIKGKGSK